MGYKQYKVCSRLYHAPLPPPLKDWLGYAAFTILLAPHQPWNMRCTPVLSLTPSWGLKNISTWYSYELIIYYMQQVLIRTCFTYMHFKNKTPPAAILVVVYWCFQGKSEPSLIIVRPSSSCVTQLHSSPFAALQMCLATLVLVAPIEI